MSHKKIITTSHAPKAIGPYSQAVESHGFLFLSGQIAIDPQTNNLIPSLSIVDQTDRVLQNIEAVLKARGLTMDHVVKTTIYLRQMKEFPIVNETYGRYFKSNPPARATVEVSGLPKDVQVEIDAIATVV